MRWSATCGATWGSTSAATPATGTRKWSVPEPLPLYGGVLATAGNVVFYGTLDGWLKAVDATTGALTEVAPAATAGNGPYSIAVDPSGRFAYAANWSSTNVSAYAINQATGALTPVGGPVAAGGGEIDKTMKEKLDVDRWSALQVYIALGQFMTAAATRGQSAQSKNAVTSLPDLPR